MACISIYPYLKLTIKIPLFENKYLNSMYFYMPNYLLKKTLFFFFVLCILYTIVTNIIDTDID